MTSHIQFGSKKIDFLLEYSTRKSLGITVTPQMDVLVRAPHNTAIEKIKEKLHKKAPWIIKQQSYFLTFHPKTPARKYISGETHLFLGRQLLLKVQVGKKEEVKHEKRVITVTVKEKAQTKQVLNDWYLQQAKTKFTLIAKPLVNAFIQKHNLKIESLKLNIRHMSHRWGSCTAKGKIILNPELIKAPKGCIEYVIIHELCHLIHHDHTQKFLALQTKEMPSWGKSKNKLEHLLS